jgi:hypothetical protein
MAEDPLAHLTPQERRAALARYRGAWGEPFRPADDLARLAMRQLLRQDREAAARLEPEP